jgi:glycerol-3-phosphate dehydrogenase (NAD(P)+)
MANMAVIGAGAWGTALASHAARLGHQTVLWAREEEVVRDVETRHRNEQFLAGIVLPDSLRATSHMDDAVKNVDLVLLVPPSQHLRSVARMLAPLLPTAAVVAVASKGIEVASGKLMSEVMAEELPSANIAYLSGPSFASEVAAGLPTDVVVASDRADVAQRVQQAMHAPYFRVYTSDDPTGVEVAGAMKNVVAVAAGACDGLGLGMNARAALITRGLAEMTRLGVALGARPLTFLGMAGVGDLLLTCTGPLSRNRTLGLKVAEGLDPREYVASQVTVAEGYTTCKAARMLAGSRGVDLPINEQVYQVLHEGRPLLDALRELVTRGGKRELEGIS